MCYLHTYDSLVHQIRGVFEVILVVWSIIYLGIAAKETTFNEKDVYMQSMALCPSRIMFLLACFLMLFTVPLRLTCQAPAENSLAILIMYMIPMYCLFFCLEFPLTSLRTWFVSRSKLFPPLPCILSIYFVQSIFVLAGCLVQPKVQLLPTASSIRS